MDTASRYYRPSGKVSPFAPVSVLLLGGVGAVVCAALYAVVIRYNPFVYFSFLATGVFGLAIGLVASMANHLGKSRSTVFNVGAALFLAAVALWAHWIVWTALRFDNGAGHALRLAMSGPAGWSQYLHWLADNYHLSVGRRVGSRAAEMSTAQMMWVWRIEALLVLAAALLAGWAGGRGGAFSEATGKWADTQLDVHTAAVDLADHALRDAMERGDFSALQSAAVVDPETHATTESFRTLAVKLVAEPADPQLRLLSVESVLNRRDEKGELKQDRTSVVHNLFVPAPVYDALLARLRGAEAAPAS